MNFHHYLSSKSSIHSSSRTPQPYYPRVLLPQESNHDVHLSIKRPHSLLNGGSNDSTSSEYSSLKRSSLSTTVNTTSNNNSTIASPYFNRSIASPKDFATYMPTLFNFKHHNMYHSPALRRKPHRLVQTKSRHHTSKCSFPSVQPLDPIGHGLRILESKKRAPNPNESNHDCFPGDRGHVAFVHSKRRRTCTSSNSKIPIDISTLGCLNGTQDGFSFISIQDLRNGNTGTNYDHDSDDGDDDDGRNNQHNSYNYHNQKTLNQSHKCVQTPERVNESLAQMSPAHSTSASKSMTNSQAAVALRRKIPYMSPSELEAHLVAKSAFDHLTIQKQDNDNGDVVVVVDDNDDDREDCEFNVIKNSQQSLDSNPKKKVLGRRFLNQATAIMATAPIMISSSSSSHSTFDGLSNPDLQLKMGVKDKQIVATKTDDAGDDGAVRNKQTISNHPPSLAKFLANLDDQGVQTVGKCSTSIGVLNLCQDDIELRIKRIRTLLSAHSQQDQDKQQQHYQQQQQQQQFGVTVLNNSLGTKLDNSGETQTSFGGAAQMSASTINPTPANSVVKTTEAMPFLPKSSLGFSSFITTTSSPFIVSSGSTTTVKSLTTVSSNIAPTSISSSSSSSSSSSNINSFPSVVVTTTKSGVNAISNLSSNFGTVPTPRSINSLTTATTTTMAVGQNSNSLSAFAFSFTSKPGVGGGEIATPAPTCVSTFPSTTSLTNLTSVIQSSSLVGNSIQAPIPNVSFGFGGKLFSAITTSTITTMPVLGTSTASSKSFASASPFASVLKTATAFTSSSSSLSNPIFTPKTTLQLPASTSSSPFALAFAPQTTSTITTLCSASFDPLTLIKPTVAFSTASSGMFNFGLTTATTTSKPSSTSFVFGSSSIGALTPTTTIGTTTATATTTMNNNNNFLFGAGLTKQSQQPLSSFSNILTNPTTNNNNNFPLSFGQSNSNIAKSSNLFQFSSTTTTTTTTSHSSSITTSSSLIGTRVGSGLLSSFGTAPTNVTGFNLNPSVSTNANVFKSTFGNLTTSTNGGLATAGVGFASLLGNNAFGSSQPSVFQQTSAPVTHTTNSFGFGTNSTAHSQIFQFGSSNPPLPVTTTTTGAVAITTTTTNNNNNNNTTGISSSASSNNLGFMFGSNPLSTHSLSSGSLSVPKFTFGQQSVQPQPNLSFTGFPNQSTSNPTGFQFGASSFSTGMVSSAATTATATNPLSFNFASPGGLAIPAGTGGFNFGQPSFNQQTTSMTSNPFNSTNLQNNSGTAPRRRPLSSSRRTRRP